MNTNVYTFARPVVRMKQVSVSTGAVVAADIVMTKVITGPNFIVFISTLIYICGQSDKRERRRKNEAEHNNFINHY